MKQTALITYGSSSLATIVGHAIVTLSSLNAADIITWHERYDSNFIGIAAMMYLASRVFHGLANKEKKKTIL